MDVSIIRSISEGKGCFGQLEVNGLVLQSVEKDWRNNKPFESCVPSGEYKLVPFFSPRFGNVLCLVTDNGDYTKEKTDTCKRYACLIHVANWEIDVVGCIGLGLTKGHNMVKSSAIAINKFYDIVPPFEEHKLTISFGEV